MMYRVIAALTIAVAVTGSAQAEIICTRTGCRETGVRVVIERDLYPGKVITDHRDGTGKKKIRVRRVWH